MNIYINTYNKSICDIQKCQINVNSLITSEVMEDKEITNNKTTNAKVTKINNKKYTNILINM